MRLVSPLLKHVVYPGLSRSGYLRRLGSSGPAVLTYHGVVPPGYRVLNIELDGHLVTAEALSQQISFLRTHYNIITPQEFLGWCEGEGQLPRGSVLMTCDDGLLNTLTDMLPIIQKMDVPFLFFVTGASTEHRPSMLWYEQLFLWLHASTPETLLGLEYSWTTKTKNAQVRTIWVRLVKQLSALDRDERAQALRALRTQLGIACDWDSEYSQNEALRRRFFMLSVNELRELRKAGVTIGARTVSHPMLSQMSAALAFREMFESRAGLEEVLGEPVWALAYPFG